MVKWLMLRVRRLRGRRRSFEVHSKYLKHTMTERKKKQSMRRNKIS